MNLFALLDQAAARFGDRGAVYHGNCQLLTWAQLRDRALRLAASIRRDAGPGARIAIASENRPEIVELMFATHRTVQAAQALSLRRRTTQEQLRQSAQRELRERLSR